MVAAREWLESEGYTVANKSQIFSFDYEGSKGGATLKIEVKGTTGDSDDAIFMTKNEVDLHTHERGKTGIIIVSGIQLEKLNEECVAKGGNLYADIGWDIGTWELVPMAFKVVRSKSRQSG